METITESVARFFSQDKNKFERIGKHSVLKIGFADKNGTFSCDIEINEENRTLQIHTTPTRRTNGRVRDILGGSLN